MTHLALALGLSGWLLSAAFNSAISYLLYRRLRLGRPSLNAVLAIVLWVFVTTAVTMIAGLVGLLTAGGLALVSSIGLGTMLILPAGRARLRPAAAAIPKAAGFLADQWRSLPAWLRWFTFAALGLSGLRFGFLIWSLPPFVWDSLTYHLTNVAHWVQAGRIELWDTPMVRIYTPANYEVLAAWFSVFLHHDALIEAAGLPAYALAIVSMLAIGRRLGMTKASAWMAAVAYGATPALLLATTGTKNDPHMAAYFLAATAFLLDLTLDRQHGEEPQQRQWLALVVTLLIAAGTKAYIVHMLPGLALIAVLAALRSGGLSETWAACRSDWMSFLKPESQLRGWMAVMIVVALFIGGYWNVRNWLLTGNPFFPYGVSIEGENLVSGPHNAAQMNTNRLVDNLAIIAGKFGDRLGPIREDLPDSTGWGWFVYVLGLPATVWGLWRSRWFRVLFIGFSLAFMLVLMATRPSPWNMRYIIWYPAVFALGFGFFIDSLAETDRLSRAAIALLFMATTGLSFLMTVNDGQIEPGQFGYMLERSVWSRHASSLHETVPAEYEYALVYAPKDEVLGYNVHGNGFIYPLYRADFSQRLVFVPVSGEDSCPAVAHSMRAAGTRYLFVAPGHSSDAVIARLQECADQAGDIRERARGLYVLKD